jgi:Tol biopolymer transport system component
VPPNKAEADDSRQYNGKIAFTHTTSYKTGDYADIYTVNPDGTGLINLTSETSKSVAEVVPAWSPDGTKIAFSSTLGEKDATLTSDYEIYVIDVNGRNLKRLTRVEARKPPALAERMNRLRASQTTCFRPFRCATLCL